MIYMALPVQQIAISAANSSPGNYEFYSRLWSWWLTHTFWNYSWILYAKKGLFPYCRQFINSFAFCSFNPIILIITLWNSVGDLDVIMVYSFSSPFSISLSPKSMMIVSPVTSPTSRSSGKESPSTLCKIDLACCWTGSQHVAPDLCNGELEWHLLLCIHPQSFTDWILFWKFQCLSYLLLL